ncbi:glycosyl hydrolase [Sediminibacterium soli]|uniref:glycosyl hydrolase n=1 Tax=Sediminibacterium soli TaxID=2698829 RepID=UPI00137AEB81|nr:glycosyl hydrolase [Sediminibacterium soli]NCI48194.1 DNA-binding protein [Sediminibacterium soli]
MKHTIILLGLLLTLTANAQQPAGASALEKQFLHPPASAKPWVFWYWMYGAVSQAGISADLEAMKQAGIGGAYLMPIKDTSSAIPFQPAVRQLTPEWWAMVRYAMQEAKRLNLRLAMHFSDGFALAGGPWITPELSMQKLVWTKQVVTGDRSLPLALQQPETNEGYYRDVAVFAYPATPEQATPIPTPLVTTGNGVNAEFLATPDPVGKKSFKTDSTCWIRYAYPQPVSIRSLRIHTGANGYQAQRLIVQASDDGIAYRTITRLEPPRHGWQDTDEDNTHAIPATTAKYFRFVYDKTGTEPGAEDLDAAKWKPSLKLMGIYPGSEPVLHQPETKNGSMWRVAARTTAEQVPAGDAVPLRNIINLTSQMDTAGILHWKIPPGAWTIVRIGHTSTGHTNATGGGGKGLECDKFNPVAIKLQFDNWFAKAFEKTGMALAGEVLNIFHVDSWECGSQNWGAGFADEFRKRRGYDLMPYLLTMTGVPVESAEQSEKIVHDARQTIADLVSDIFYRILQARAHELGCHFSGESVAPTMVSDGMLHYKQVDLPMGEFWLNSPTHDKPSDVLDAISGAHIYGKPLVAAEAFTSVRMNWGEHPGNIKTLGDRNFALGINKLVLHVFTHNPWLDKKPGMTLDGIGLYFQRDQTWFGQANAWISYLARCQALLQAGKPVTDIAVFSGEEIPRRAVLPDRLVGTLTGIFGQAKQEAERIRLENRGQPLRTIPDGVTHAAGMADPEDWIDPLQGYAYDSFNPDALLQMEVRNGRVVLPGGASYAVLVLPGKHPLQPNPECISLAVATKLLQLVKQGATVIMHRDYAKGIGNKDEDRLLKPVLEELFSEKNKKGRIIWSPYTAHSFASLGSEPDLRTSSRPNVIAWTHRSLPGADLYFISNQTNESQSVDLSFRITGKIPELWDPVTATITSVSNWYTADHRTLVQQSLAPAQSLFVVFRKKTGSGKRQSSAAQTLRQYAFTAPWQLQFDSKSGGPSAPVDIPVLQSWSLYTDPGIRYYSGTAVYRNRIYLTAEDLRTPLRLVMDSVCNIASVKINGQDCGTLWTPPYELGIGKVLKPGWNNIAIAVSNTWHNRLIGDELLPVQQRVSWTNAPFRLKGKPLLPAGLMGTIKLVAK